MQKRHVLAALAALPPLLIGSLFAWNGTETSWRVPEHGTTNGEPSQFGEELRVMAFNIAKCFFHAGGLDFASARDVTRRLDDITDLVRRERIDLLFLSEVVFQATPCPVNQVEYLAERAGFHAWSYGDNYSFGVPGCRIRCE